jgi:hypothetical protein
MTLEMPRDEPELEGLTKTGKFNFFKILLIILFFTSLSLRSSF